MTKIYKLKALFAWRILALDLVYFDQRAHACPCVPMVENEENPLKIIIKVIFSSCLGDAHVVT